MMVDELPGPLYACLALILVFMNIKRDKVNHWKVNLRLVMAGCLVIFLTHFFSFHLNKTSTKPPPT